MGRGSQRNVTAGKRGGLADQQVVAEWRDQFNYDTVFAWAAHHITLIIICALAIASLSRLWRSTHTRQHLEVGTQNTRGNTQPVKRHNLPQQSTKQTAGAQKRLQPSLQYIAWLVADSSKRTRACRAHLAKISTSRGLVTRSTTRSGSGVPVAVASLRDKISSYNMTESGNRAGPWFAAHLAAGAIRQAHPRPRDLPYLRDIIAHEIISPSHFGRFRAGKNNFWQGLRETGKFTGHVCAKPGSAGVGSAR